MSLCQSQLHNYTSVENMKSGDEETVEIVRKESIRVLNTLAPTVHACISDFVSIFLLGKSDILSNMRIMIMDQKLH